MADARPRVRAKRSDAKVNRERLLASAEDYFSEAGLDAPLHELTRRVGLSIGTLYRHFPTNADLIRALYDRAIERLDLVAERCAEQTTGWDALVAFIDGFLGVIREVPFLPELMRRQLENDPTYDPAARYREPTRGYVARAIAEGSLRPDVTGTDIAAIPPLLSAALAFPEPARSVILARQRALVLDGLRADPSRRDPLPGSSITADEFRAAAHRQQPRST